MALYEVPSGPAPAEEQGAFAQLDRLRHALLDIEWASRRERPTPMLRRINDMARSALRESTGARVAAR